VCAKRSKLLPEGGEERTINMIKCGHSLSKAVENSRNERRLRWAEDARQLWHQVYGELSRERLGMFGAITARAEAQVVRLALVYALIDGSELIELTHLKGGLEVWRYAEQSAAYIFGASLGDPLADSLLAALKGAGAGGMTRTQLSRALGNHKSGAALDRALGLLLAQKLATMQEKGTDGRTSHIWRAC
jgi:hypothetical protein